MFLINFLFIYNFEAPSWLIYSIAVVFATLMSILGLVAFRKLFPNFLKYDFYWVCSGLFGGNPLFDRNIWTPLPGQYAY